MTNTNASNNVTGNTATDQNTTVIEQQDSAKRGETTTTTLPPQQPASPTEQPGARTEQYGAQNAFGTAYGSDPRNQATYQAGANDAAQAEAAFRNQSGYGYGPNGQTDGFAGAPGAYAKPAYASAFAPNAPATSGSQGIDDAAGATSAATLGAGAPANGKTKLGGKAIAIIAGVTLVCGLLGGVAGGATVSALTKSDRPDTSQMPGGSSDGFAPGGQHGQSGQGGGMGQMPGGMSGSGSQGSNGFGSSGSDSGSSSGSSGSSSSYSGTGSEDGSIAS